MGFCVSVCVCVCMRTCQTEEGALICMLYFGNLRKIGYPGILVLLELKGLEEASVKTIWH